MRRLLLTLMIVALAPLFLMGQRSYAGDTFAYVSGDQVVICDHSRDGTNAYAKFGRRGSSETRYVKDGNGANPGCGISGHGRRVTDFTACKASPWSPFPRCGNTVYR